MQNSAKIYCEAQFKGTLKRLALTSRASISSHFAELCARYEEPHRAYHTFEHIAHCLRILQRCSRLADDHDSVTLAILYHDSIYSSDAEKGKRNEERSAQFAITELRELTVVRQTVVKVSRQIIATKHNTTLKDSDEQLVADLDLASLGSSWRTFKENGRAIRFEYQHVPEVLFNEARVRILQTFLNREHLYYHSWFREQFEKQARKNLTRAIQELTSIHA